MDKELINGGLDRNLADGLAWERQTGGRDPIWLSASRALANSSGDSAS